MITIAIIGSSGSHNTMHIYTPEKIAEMITAVEKAVEDFGWDEVELWSGGSSGADHVAVLLALKHDCVLRLFLPCIFNKKFDDNGNYNYSQNCGKLLNELHAKFSRNINSNTFIDLENVIKRDKTFVRVHNGMLARNHHVAKADSLIAFTQSTLDKPVEGGTLHTWNLSKSDDKIHIKI